MYTTMRNRWLAILGGTVILAGIVVAVVPAQEPQKPTGDVLLIPDEARKRTNPIPVTPETIEYGKLLYSSQCVMCHGASGDGTGDLVERLKLDMPDLTDAAAMTKRTDGDLFYILDVGHKRMPSQGKRLQEDGRWKIVSYVRTLAKAP